MEERATVILVAPHWPKGTWFSHSKKLSPAAPDTARPTGPPITRVSQPPESQTHEAFGLVTERVTMSKSSSASGPQQVKKYTLRVALKKVEYYSDSSEEDEELKKPPVVPSSDSEEEPPNAFLQRRAKNIEDNKAMLAKLMADLEKLPGHLESDSNNQNHGTPKYSRRSRGSLVAAEPRRNPERATRRVTRSMGTVLPSSPDKNIDDQSLVDQLLEEREPIRRRRSSRPSIHTIPHVVRPVEEITEDDLKNVADNVKEKVYNTVYGSTCHQCRQKTMDTKTNCRNVECRGIQGQFCGPCLRNRYGEDVCKALLDPDWTCPPCRGICNCSFCRQRDGRCATGILFPLARYNGYSDVHSYLER
ncbi:cell division cycle-associated protein 7-like [Aquarana catesbeiana]|uniref:cell division cycle-associated protein 7-like n=1 Tax=Aquarana catesbeiana TaxID=8400 RepID=UPI003CC992C9